jgi:hypothetical protein
LAQLLQVMILLASGGANGGGYLASKYVLIAMHGGILFLHALINSLNITWLSYITIIAAAWNVVGECSNSNTLIHPTHPNLRRSGGGVLRRCMGYSTYLVIVYRNIPNVYLRQIFYTLCLCNFFYESFSFGFYSTL